MKIRTHRETLEDAMATEQEIEPNIESVRAYFTKGSFWPELYKGDIKVEPYGFDERINWNTHIVTVDGNAIGFTDGPLSKI